MLAAVLALSSSLTWGLADFIGGLQSRRHPLLTVLVLSQGFALLLILVAIAGGAAIEHDTASTLWAAGAGALGVLGLMCFYRALAIGTMSIVAPISATGTVIPVVVGLASGERPSTLQIGGMVLAIVGVILAGRDAAEPGSEAHRTGRAAVLLALIAAVGFGSFFVGVHQAQETADTTWVLLAARGPEVLILLVIFAVTRPGMPSSRGALLPILAAGFFDLLANLLFVLAVERGLLSVVGVLGALYPAVTVLLARAVLHERLTRSQDVGVVITLAGVVVLGAG
jgi:drug/metabolite transporter (DMT)-like permease